MDEIFGSHLALFPKNSFLTSFGGHLEFLCKMHVSEKIMWDEAIYAKYLVLWIYTVICQIFQKIFYSAIFGSHLEFESKIEKHIYLRNRAVRNRVLWMKFLVRMVYAEWDFQIFWKWCD